MLTSLPSSKLTGAFGSNDASALTGLTAATVSASDPTLTTNPSVVGTMWANSTNGFVFICTDTTTNKNTWINVGDGLNNIHSSSFQGEIAGFMSGGHGGGFYQNAIFRYSYLQDGHATDHGDLAKFRYQCSGSSSATHGYTCAGYGPNSGFSNSRTEIDRFAFNSSSNAVEVGVLSASRRRCTGQSSSTHGYNTGGDAPPPTDTISKYSFASTSAVSNIGSLTIERSGGAGQSSSTHGYTSGGTFIDGVPQPYDVIDNFPFANDTSATDVGNLTESMIAGNNGCSSATDGYYCGGYRGGAVPPTSRDIQKFSFASQNNAVDVAQLLTVQSSQTGTSSVNYGYVSGGGSSNTEIQKFNFASDSDSTDVGDLVIGMESSAGQQF